MDLVTAGKVIEFLAGIDRVIHITGIAKALGEEPMKIHRIVKKLEDDKIIVTQQVGKSQVVFLKKDSGVFSILLFYKSKQIKNPDKILEEAKKVYDSIQKRAVL
ncbi:hypothetical protein HYU06_03955 [Candidatus Woesearchaeota archaeon]|nr:hypothetical protein [Candidatus Woesearchaeota archaeon]